MRNHIHLGSGYCVHKHNILKALHGCSILPRIRHGGVVVPYDGEGQHHKKIIKGNMKKLSPLKFSF